MAGRAGGANGGDNDSRDDEESLQSSRPGAAVDSNQYQPYALVKWGVATASEVSPRMHSAIGSSAVRVSHVNLSRMSPNRRAVSRASYGA